MQQTPHRRNGYKNVSLVVTGGTVLGVIVLEPFNNNVILMTCALCMTVDPNEDIVLRDVI